MSAAPQPARIHSDQELELMIAGMENASNRFYLSATQIGNHAFIEFVGLMNEYIKICRQTMKADRDFTTANVHVGEALQVEPYNIAYLFEKLDCIFGTTITAELRRKLEGLGS